MKDTAGKKALKRLEKNVKAVEHAGNAVEMAIWTNKKKILDDFMEQAKCMPSEAELVVETVAGGVRLFLRKRTT